MYGQVYKDGHGFKRQAVLVLRREESKGQIKKLSAKQSQHSSVIEEMWQERQMQE